MLITLWHHLSDRRKKQFWLLLILMIVASLAEAISVGAVLPFLGVLTAPEYVYQHSSMQPLIQFLEITDASQLVFPLTTIFIIAALVAGLIRLALLFAMTRLTYAAGADLSINIYRRTLHQEYMIHMTRNSSEMINAINGKTSAVIGKVMLPFLKIISSIVLIIGVMSVLFTIDIIVALSAFIGFFLLYMGISFYTKKRLGENSKIIANQSTQMIKSLQEGLGGIRDVLIDNSQQFYCKLYRNADLPFRRASGDNQFIAGSPRYIMEMIGMVLIAVTAYIMLQDEASTSKIVPFLGTLAMGAQRMLPSLQQIYGSYSSIRSSKASFKDVLDLLEQPFPHYSNLDPINPMQFNREIKLENLSFRYAKNTPWILKDINLSIHKGSRVGFIGLTGSGKSTMLDIIMGLLPPTKGALMVDREYINTKNIRDWQANIAHVPQQIFLSDSSIEENIAFGIPKEKINHQQVKKSAKIAQLLDLIRGWKDGYQTFVGERGSRLSGGQKQRIGIARALYKQTNVLILDEATSALDNKTERSVIDNIDRIQGNVTILMVAHRLSTLEKCDVIIEIENGNIKRQGTPAEIIGTNKMRSK